MQQLSTEWAYRLEINAHQLPGYTPARPARELVANALRSLAQWLDGRHSLAVRITTTPALSPRQKRECFDHAADAWQRALGQTALAEAQEQLLRQQRPDMFPQA